MKASIYNIFVPAKPQKYILLNTLTGRIFEVDKAAKVALENFSERQFDNKQIEDLKEAGILVDDDVDERRVFKVHYEYGKYVNPNAFFTVLTTYRCNLACTYCYERYFFETENISRNETMDGQAAEKTVKFIQYITLLNNYKRVYLTLYGGEPLLNLAANSKILQTLHEWTNRENLAFTPLLFTNGVLLTDDIIKDYSKYGMHFRVTLAGTREFHDKKRIRKDGKGSFDDTMKAIERLQDSKANFRLRLDVDKDNCRSMFSLLDELHDRFGEELAIRIYAVIGGSLPCYGTSTSPLTGEELHVLPELWEKAFNMGFDVSIPSLVNWVYCTAVTNHSYVVDPICDVYKCCGLVGLKKHKIGTINEEGKLSKMDYVFYDWMSRDPLTTEECKNCSYLPACGGGCPAVTYDRYKTYHKGYCLSIQQLIEDCARIWAKLKEKSILWKDEIKQDNLTLLGY